MAIRSEERRDTWEMQEGDEIASGLIALQLLGGGTRYEAFLAFDEQLHHATVAKMLRPDLIEDEGALRGLRDEAEVLASLNHPAIARLLRAAIDDERPHIVLEFVEGPRLSTLIRRFGPLEVEQAAPLAVEVASALHYLHGLGDRAPRRQAEEPHHGGAASSDRSQHRAVARGGGEPDDPGRHRRVHGAGAVPAGARARRSGGRRLGSRRDVARGAARENRRSLGARRARVRRPPSGCHSSYGHRPRSPCGSPRSCPR